ncbi:FtsW/RodA/SpoVE family cell cycle protein [Deinococcus metallilatus]|uniref:Cell division protein FtsW n=1 Tax=Deinococcus metallilatus TaxID=1211322 RepID=A0AAJ5JY61_9DEIO|nr:FtsW/RodA/SpoVE family cell cycle protein [Deinococcus metallilatus]MBB5295912.1 cell division protein FtsW [Deinococcus metallilatus]QBY08254.1 FtsW/RodA/SpoVE family cell cycle protein [Deinococcus metallilatus]RXJ11985.1 FtsW/RodA/SpoVE family cell cycle protein [Deinococcus metallilatus]TLK25783.1 FtsW/RodA/SpoVE family cell cycle protein [Deinococcus metallilatus]GMA14554.1 cell division protein FtsW [Deinococcus metallilatus]
MSLQLVIAQVLLLTLGLLGVATARPDLILDHGSKALLALVVTFAAARLRPRAFLKIAPYFWGVTLLLLLLTLFIGHGTETSEGTKRWLELGPMRFQPSELAKLGLVLQLASFFSRRGVQHKLISATLMIVVTTGLVILEPDLGSSVLIFGLGIILMYAAGVRITNITGFVFALALIGIPFLGRYLERNSYILERFFGHVNRGQTMEVGLDQIGMAHRDLSFGGLWGLGPDGPRWTYFAAHTDMVVASVGFTSGLLGVAMLLFAYWLIVSTALQVSQLATRVRPMTPEIHGATIMATGAMFMVVGQAFVNLAVAAGIFPVTGVPLPLVSYGFSSMLTMSLALGVIHSAMREVRRHLPQSEVSPDIVPVPAD